MSSETRNKRNPVKSRVIIYSLTLKKMNYWVTTLKVQEVRSNDGEECKARPADRSWLSNGMKTRLAYFVISAESQKSAEAERNIWTVSKWLTIEALSEVFMATFCPAMLSENSGTALGWYGLC